MLINAIHIFTFIIFTASVFKNRTIHSLQIHNKLNRWFEYPTKSIWHTRINHNNWGITVFSFPHDIEKLGTKSWAFSFIEGKDSFQNSFKKTYDLISSFPFGTCFLGRNGLCLLPAVKNWHFCWQRMIKLQYSQMSTTVKQPMFRLKYHFIKTKMETTIAAANWYCWSLETNFFL